MKTELKQLRNRVVLLFLVTNILWLGLIETTASHIELGHVFLVVYGSVIAIQFLAMIWHRLITFNHWLTRTLDGQGHWQNTLETVDEEEGEDGMQPRTKHGYSDGSGTTVIGIDCLLFV